MPLRSAANFLQGNFFATAVWVGERIGDAFGSKGKVTPTNPPPQKPTISRSASSLSQTTTASWRFVLAIILYPDLFPLHSKEAFTAHPLGNAKQLSTLYGQLLRVEQKDAPLTGIALRSPNHVWTFTMEWLRAYPKILCLAAMRHSRRGTPLQCRKGDCFGAPRLATTSPRYFLHTR